MEDRSQACRLPGVVLVTILNFTGIKGTEKAGHCSK
jgi:hypothetical protein